MGGLIIVITTIFIYFFIKIYLKSALTVDDFFLFFPFLGFGLIGFIDDFLSIKRHENTGLTPTKKFIFLTNNIIQKLKLFDPLKISGCYVLSKIEFLPSKAAY